MYKSINLCLNEFVERGFFCLGWIVDRPVNFRSLLLLFHGSLTIPLDGFVQVGPDSGVAVEFPVHPPCLNKGFRGYFFCNRIVSCATTGIKSQSRMKFPVKETQGFLIPLLKKQGIFPG